MRGPISGPMAGHPAAATAPGAIAPAASRWRAWSGLRAWPAAHTIPVLALLVFNLADVATTHHIIGIGGREMNPVAGWLLANGWLLATKLALVAMIAVLLSMAPRRQWVTRSLWALTTFYGTIITYHMVLLATR